MFQTRHHRCKQSPLDMARVRINIAKYLVPILPEFARPDANNAFQCVVAFPNHTGQYASCEDLGNGIEFSRQHRPCLPHLFPQLTGGTCYPSPRSFPLTPSWVRDDVNPGCSLLHVSPMAVWVVGLYCHIQQYLAVTKLVDTCVAQVRELQKGEGAHALTLQRKINSIPTDITPVRCLFCGMMKATLHFVHTPEVFLFY